MQTLQLTPASGVKCNQGKVRESSSAEATTDQSSPECTAHRIQLIHRSPRAEERIHDERQGRAERCRTLTRCRSRLPIPADSCTPLAQSEYRNWRMLLTFLPIPFSGNYRAAAWLVGRGLRCQRRGARACGWNLAIAGRRKVWRSCEFASSFLPNTSFRARLRSDALLHTQRQLQCSNPSCSPLPPSPPQFSPKERPPFPPAPSLASPRPSQALPA